VISSIYFLRPSCSSSNHLRTANGCANQKDDGEEDENYLEQLAFLFGFFRFTVLFLVVFRIINRHILTFPKFEKPLNLLPNSKSYAIGNVR
jgi:hypothetical protein